MSKEKACREAMLGAFEGAVSEYESSPEGYEIFHELDRGGMAVVYQARQLQPDRAVALKVMLPRFAGDAETGIRFQREGRAMAALDHPAVLPVYQVGEWEDMPFIAMKLATAGTLQQRLEEGLPDVREAVDWLISVGEAVHYAHQRGILHRDLKPGNLLFDEDGGIYVGDFGVAKLEFIDDGSLTRTEAFVGTPNYLAPEVAAGESNAGSVTADLYGLGAVLYECLTGRRPHDEAESLAAQLRSIVENDVVPVRKLNSNVALDLEVICGKALAKNPAERYESVARFVDDLERWRDGRSITARPASAIEKVFRWVKRHPLSAFLLGLFLLTVFISTLLLVENYQRRGELLQESLLDQARTERLLHEPGYRDRALQLLEGASQLGDSQRIRDEASAVLAGWDIGRKSETPITEQQVKESSFQLQEIDQDIRLTGQDSKGDGWLLPGKGTLHCDPAWSYDERFLALVRGDRMEVTIYDVNRRVEFSRISVKSWPEELIFDDERLKILFEDGSAALANLRGKFLLEGFDRDMDLLRPVAVKTWKGQAFTPSETNPLGGSLSPDEVYLATVSVSGLQIWDVVKGRSVDFYETENQRIDAPTDAWWVSERELILQVPGSLQKLTIGSDGVFENVTEMDRVPGMRIESILENGDWIIQMRDEDGEQTRVIWQNGEEGRKRAYTSADLLKSEEGPDLESPVKVNGWTLELPRGERVKRVFILSDQIRVIILTQKYSLYEWNLRELQQAVKGLGM